MSVRPNTEPEIWPISNRGGTDEQSSNEMKFDKWTPTAIHFEKMGGGGSTDKLTDM